MADNVTEMPAPVIEPPAPMASRSDLQLGRRLFHAANGTTVGVIYAVLVSQIQVVRTFGTVACLVYVADRIRIHYPELVERAPWVNRYIVRAEEQFRESAMIPYVIGTLLTILTFPKAVAISAIWTLAIADPLSAIVGIQWGRRRLLPNRTAEGSAAFFAATCGVTLVALVVAGNPWSTALAASALVGLAAALFDLAPVRLDDNLTIPLFVGFVGWVVAAGFGLTLD
jgi:dolichol kinase